MVRLLGLMCGVVCLAQLGCGAGGASAEVYSVEVNPIVAADACYVDAKPPTTQTTASEPTPQRWKIFDAPDAKAFLEATVGIGSAQLGNAPSVPLGGVYHGTKAGAIWTFTSNRITVDKQPILMFTVTTNTKATLTFERGGGPVKGTLKVESSRICEGTCLPEYARLNPPCTVDAIPIAGTRVAVTYLETP